MSHTDVELTYRPRDEATSVRWKSAWTTEKVHKLHGTLIDSQLVGKIGRLIIFEHLQQSAFVKEAVLRYTVDEPS